MGQNMKTLVAMCICAGCQSEDATKTVAVEPNELGIVQLEIEHGVTAADRVLTLRGLGAGGEELATSTLRTGDVWYTGEGSGAWSAGTELSLRVGDATSVFVTPDREAHEQRVLPGPLSSFAKLREVVSTIQTEAGIRLVAAPADTGDVAYNGANCNPAQFKNAATNCCQDSQYIFHVSSHGALINRYGYDATYPKCRTSGGSLCTGDSSQCLYGPCGAAVNKWGHCNVHTGATCGIDLDCSSLFAGEWCSVANNTAKVFVPTTTLFCGWDKNTTTTVGTVNQDFNPENFNTSNPQTLYPNGTASCNSVPTGCNNGTPANKLSGSIPAHGTGKLGAYGTLSATNSAPSMLLDNSLGPASGSSWVVTNNTTTVTACPDSGLATAHISGACTANGLAGVCVSCTITMSADKTVTATFACTQDFAC